MAKQDRGREGPRPLPLHMGAAMLTWLTSRGALSGLSSGSLPWRPELAEQAQAIRTELAALDLRLFEAAVDAEAKRRLQSFLDGVNAYRSHAYRRTETDPPVLLSCGTTRLLDYGGIDGGAGVLVVPSLVNRARILDLTVDRSLVRYLAGRGMRPLLVDWGAPGDEETGFGLDDYIAGRLDDLLTEAVKATGGPVVLAGYCMGGLLALPLAQRRPEAVRGLALLATPWDFHRGLAAQRRMMQALAPQIDLLIEAAGNLPVDTLQAMFAAIDPFGVPAKFRAFSDVNPTTRKAARFVAMEDWLNDGVPLVEKVARECLHGWYLENLPGRGRWKIDGRAVLPAEVEVPTAAFVPLRDRIVPPPSAKALADGIPRAQMKPVRAGHIGMTAGSRAATLLYRPLSLWLEGVIKR